MHPQEKQRVFPRRDRAIALLDQILYAGTNFALTMLLAWLARMEALGHFALIASISALLHSLFVGFVLEPLTVYGSKHGDGQVRRVYGYVSSLVCVSCLLIASLLYAASNGEALEYVRIASLGFGLFAGQGAVLCAKRMLVLERGVSASLVVSIRYAGGALLAAVAFVYIGTYNEQAVVVTILVASLIAAGDWWAASVMRRCSMSEFVQVVSSVKRYTVWTVVTSIPATLSVHGIFWIAEIASDRTVVGQLKLCEQLLVPLGQVFATMSLLDQIESAADYSAHNRKSVLQRLQTRTWAYVRMAGVYALALIFIVVGFGAAGGNVTQGFAAAFGLYCVTTLITAYSIPRNVAAKACRRPEYVASAYVLMAATIWLAGLFWRPAGLMQLVFVLIAGWFAHALALQVRMSRMLTSPLSP